MSFIEIFLIGIGLSMDAFAVSICKGLAMPKLNAKHTAVIGLFFGGFQALMPLAGYYVSNCFAKYIQTFDHWIVFILLSFIGGHMLISGIKGEEETDKTKLQKLDIVELFILAVATSIDALAVGVSFAFLNVNIWHAITIIGITTLILSVVGVVIGHCFGAKYKDKAEIVGGAILIAIGVKILLEHLFF